MKAVLSNLDLRDHEQGPNMNNMMSSLDDADYAACSLRPEKIVETTKGRSHNSDSCSLLRANPSTDCFLLPQYSSLSICHLVNLQRSQVWLIFSLIFCSAVSQYLIKICKLFSDPCVGHHVVSLSLSFLILLHLVLEPERLTYTVNGQGLGS